MVLNGFPHSPRRLRQSTRPVGPRIVDTFAPAQPVRRRPLRRLRTLPVTALGVNDPRGISRGDVATRPGTPDQADDDGGASQRRSGACVGRARPRQRNDGVVGQASPPRSCSAPDGAHRVDIDLGQQCCEAGGRQRGAATIATSPVGRLWFRRSSCSRSSSSAA